LHRRSTTINFVHVNSRSLYIVDQRMVVVEGGCPTPCKKEGELSGREKCPGKISVKVASISVTR